MENSPKEKSKLMLELDKTGLNYMQKAQLENANKLKAEKSKIFHAIENPIEFWESPEFVIGKYKNDIKAYKQEFLFKTWIKLPENFESDYKQISEVSFTYDMQLLITLGYIHDGLNSKFAHYASKMIDIK